MSMARDAASRGDSIEAENLYQHAEHYFRVMREQVRRAAIVGAIIGVAALAGCASYPPVEEVAACATARFGTEHGSFNVTQRPGSVFSASEYSIIYQKDGSPDRALVVYYRRNGPVTTQQEISYGNHAEIAGAVEAMKYCAQPR
jgi:hypothetical protein